MIPLQDMVDTYANRWSRATDAEPVLDGRSPQLYRANGQSPETLVVTTVNQNATSAWTRGEIHTGEADVDDVIGLLGPKRIRWNSNDPSLFGIELEGPVYSEDLVAYALSEQSIEMSDPMHLPQDDGAWTWLDDGTAQIDFRFGWGDCFVACDGFHSVRAVVPPTGEATVYDLGGDPLPDGLTLAPGTHPLP